MVFLYPKEDFILSEKSVGVVFSFKDGIKLNQERYCDELCEQFGIHIKCPIKIVRKKCNRNSISFNVCCIINDSIQYSLKCFKEDIYQGKNLKLQVLCNTDISCMHESLIEGRQLKGSARKDVQKKLLTKTPKQVRNEAILSLDIQQSQAGNMTSVHPLSVYQKARSEVLARNDLRIDSIEDVQERAKMERNNGDVFIQSISMLPFSVILFCENNFKILHQANKNGLRIQGHLDATGGIIRRVSKNSLLNHCLVFPTKANSINKNKSVIVVCELITEDNCSYNIESFLRLVKTKYQHLFKKERMFESIVTDKSYANINAIIQSQNSITLLEYLNILYDKRTDWDGKTNLTLVFLCSSHLAKIWKSDIKKSFKNLDNEDIYFICGLIGNAVNIRRYEELKKYIQNLINFFYHKQADSAFLLTLQRLKEAFEDDDCWIYQLNYENEGDNLDECKINKASDNQISNSLYKESPFFKEFDDYMNRLNLESLNEKCDENIFYSPKFIKHFLKNSVAILPLWSAVFFSNGMEHEQIKRPNNGYIEGHFSSLKNMFRSNLSYGKLGSIKIGRYIEAVKNSNLCIQKEITQNIPNKHVMRKKKGSDITTADLPIELERWKGKSRGLCVIGPTEFLMDFGRNF